MKSVRALLLTVIAATVLSLSAKADVLMRGYIDYGISWSHAQVFIEDIVNYSPEPTGPLRLRLWASKDHWTSDHPGVLLGGEMVRRIRGNGRITDKDPTFHIRRPHRGWYTITLTLEERIINEEGRPEYVLRDAVEFDDEFYFSDRRVPRFVWPF